MKIHYNSVVISHCQLYQTIPSPGTRDRVAMEMTQIPHPSILSPGNVFYTYPDFTKLGQPSLEQLPTCIIFSKHLIGTGSAGDIIVRKLV